ncbi:hypothetical protein JQ607_01565 [Bradyrhizobium liaoningense]|uniref:SGNH/GDSL hydrolase family protein n=1 Tax=Bradyrhizobium liaoningense TaxID=43992 RepID=UPI001BAC7578|nr:SGNH/GDSL hydrolase family protein [Bradyrhizobium liaoningense]MBR0838872.1 hypothetical protein [Bradyrhizobium liaoningense]
MTRLFGFIGLLAILSVHLSPDAAFAKSKRILVFGDSNTWGSTPRIAGQPVTRLPDNERWAGVLASGMSDHDTVVLVDGLTGRTTDVDRKDGIGAVNVGSDFNGAKALRAAMAREMPLDLVVIMLGTNDLAPTFDRTPDAIAESAMNLADTVRSSAGGTATAYPAPGVLVVVPPVIGDTTRPPMSILFGGAQSKSGLLSAAFIKAGQRRNVPVFDASIVTKTDGEDGIHLTPENHRVLANALAPIVNAMMRDIP